MVNEHDDWRPTGEQRIWPNLLTAEGIRGNEEMPDATRNTVLPFVRYLAGAADYMICYYDPRIKTTYARQLALSVVHYSPLQTLYWYDKPELSHDEPELAFWDRIPTTWNETRVLDWRPGQSMSVARRKGDEWFDGSITNNDARTESLHFDFLPSGRRYEATIYAGDPTAPTRTRVGVQTRKIDAATVLTVDPAPSGGQAIGCVPCPEARRSGCC